MRPTKRKLRAPTSPSVRSDTPPHVLWTGCGAMLGRSCQALTVLRDQGATLTFTDVKELEEGLHEPPPGCEFLNVSTTAQRQELRKRLRRHPLTHIYVANWPSLHLLTAFKYSEACPKGPIVIPKPLDTNFQLIETVAANAFPAIAHQLFVHDHYLNKSVVTSIHDAFPSLVEEYGELRRVSFYLVEFQTIEDEGRLKALEQGVIFDLQSHLLSLLQLFFLTSPWPACRLRTGTEVSDTRVEITRVARARYIGCDLPDMVETFAAVELKIVVTYAGRSEPHEISGLLVAGKGIKPTESVEADLKGFRLEFALGPRTANLADGTINPPLKDLDFVVTRETGFYEPILYCLSHPRTELGLESGARRNGHRLLTFDEARRNASLMHEIRQKGEGNLVYYKRQTETLREVIARCVGAGNLNHEWLPKGEFSDIGYSKAE